MPSYGAASSFGDMQNFHASTDKKGQHRCPFSLEERSGINYLLHCSMAILIVVLLPFLGVSSLNFGPLATAAFFLARVPRQPRRRNERPLQGMPRLIHDARLFGSSVTCSAA
jgi:hypothetical protein